MPRGPPTSECAVKYLAALAQPFSGAAVGACLPYEPSHNSLKVTTVQRFNLTTNASGVGILMIAPCIANDQGAIWYTDTTGVDSGIVCTANTPPAGWLVRNFVGIPFTAAQIASGGVAGRVVSVGLRVQYLGVASAMGGSFSSYVDPEHANVNDTFGTNANFYASPEVKVQRVTAKPFEQGFGIIKPTEAAYKGVPDARATQTTIGVAGHSWIYPWSMYDINGVGSGMTGSIVNGAPPIMFRIAGSVSQVYYVEVIQHLEYVGRTVAYGATASHNDQPTATKIDHAVNEALSDFNNQPGSSWSECLRKAVTSFNPGLAMRVAGELHRGIRHLQTRQHGALMLQH